MASTIQSLINEGALVLYHDYRAGHLKDMSGNSNDGVATGTQWCNQGLQLEGTNDVVTVADSLEQQIDEGTIVIMGDFMSQPNNDVIFSKRDGVGTTWHLYTTTTNVSLFDSAGDHSVVKNISGHSCIGINFKSGDSPDLYCDGNFCSAMNPASNITVGSQDILIGNWVAGGRNTEHVLRAALLINRTLTAAEHAALYTELGALTWPTKPQARTSGSYAWTSGWGAKEIANVAPGSYIPGTPFYVGSGAYKVDVETINGKDHKILECTNVGIVYMETSEIHGGDIFNAYGTWDFWMAKGLAANTPRVYFISSVAQSPHLGNGYALYSNAANNNLILYENPALGAKMTSENNAITPGVWDHYKITRASGGIFTVYLNGVALPVVSGSNPVTDNTTTTSTHLVFDLDAGDKICLGDVKGDGGFAKHHSVV